MRLFIPFQLVDIVNMKQGDRPLWAVLCDCGVQGHSAKGCWVSVHPEQELGSHCWQEIRPVSGACWTLARLHFVTGCVHNFYGQNFSAKPGAGGVQVGNRKTSSVTFTDDDVCLASSRQDFSMYRSSVQLNVKQPGRESEPPNPKQLDLDWKSVACPLWVGGNVLPAVGGILKVSRGLLHRWGKMECETDRQVDGASAVMLSLLSTLPFSPMVINVGH